MFRLIRYFSTTSLVAFAIVTVLLAVLYRQTAINGLVALGENKNMALTHAFANSLWPEFAPLVASASGLTGEELQAHPAIAALQQAVRAQMKGSSVLKVKVYDMKGLTVFSTDATQIGQDKSDNLGFQAAISGEMATELTHRDTFSVFEDMLVDRDVISSYIPIYNLTGDLSGVFEVYDDVTPLLAQIEARQWDVIIGVVLILVALYGLLFAIVRRAEQIMRRQQAERLRMEEALHRADIELGVAVEKERIRWLKEMVSAISHDVKTPLSTINARLYMLLKTTDPDKQQQLIEMIREQMRRLTQLTEGLFTISHLDVGEDFNFQPTDLNRVVRTVRGGRVSAAESQQITLVMELDAEIPAVEADERQLNRALLKIVDNALHHTNGGGRRDDPHAGGRATGDLRSSRHWKWHRQGCPTPYL
jgi:signal transduction histidine kinase